MQHRLGLWIALAVLAGVFLFAVPQSAHAQADANACPALVQKALTDIGTNCSEVGRNSACYGFNRVAASFLEAQEENFFSTPADRTELRLLDTLQTAPLDSTNNLWGIAVLNVQANVPNSLPGQAVVFMLLGDVQIDNAVAPEDAITPVDPINVSATTNANLRSGPGTLYNVVSSLANGAVIGADGVSDDGDWVRVLKENIPLWISRDLVRPEVEGAIDTLPILTGGARTPMQAFYFRTGFTGVECIESPPSLLVVQGPENVKVNLTANGADIQIGSTIALFTNDQNEMVLMVVDGSALVGGIEIPPGFAMTVKLGADGNVEGGWYGFRAITFDELQGLVPLQKIPASLLHYPIILPTLDQIAAYLDALRQPTAVPTAAATADPNIGGPNVVNTTPVVVQPPVNTSGGTLPTPGQYSTNGGNCPLPASARVGNIAPDGNSFTWGVLTVTRVDPVLFVSRGGIYIRIISPTVIRVGGEVNGACIADWQRVGD